MNNVRQIARCFFSAFFSCLLLCHSAEGANNDDSRSSEIDTIAGAYVTEGSPGFAIAVIRQGELIFLKGYGLAEIKSGRSIDVDSSFRLASVSKQFTAIAIAMLAERGKLKYEDDVCGDGGIYATVSDMANWAIALDGNRLINEKTRKHIFSTGHLNNGKRIDYGFGWRVEPDGNDAEPLIWHSGGWVGFSTYSVIYPARDLKIVVLSNNSGLKTYEMTEKIDKLYP